MQGEPCSDNWSLDIPLPFVISEILPNVVSSHSPLNSGNLKGGTFYTVREAKRQGLDIVNLHNSV